VRVLAAVDGSQTSRAAARFAALLVSRCPGATLTLITAGGLSSRKWIPVSKDGRLPDWIPESDRVWPERVLEDGRREAESLGVSARAAYVGIGRRGAIEETIAEAIAGAARRDRTDLIVVGSGGAKQFARWLLGSVTHRLVHSCGLPVAVVRVGAAGKDRPFRILAAADGSKPSRQAVAFAARLAASIPGAALIVLTVSTLSADIALTGTAFVRALGVLPGLDRAERKAAERILRDAAVRTRPLGERASFVYRNPRRPRPAAQAIVREASLQGADLIVLGNTGRSGLNDLVLGSVAQRVLDLSRRPVVLVRKCPSGRG
jgi:nucleotide-binding universal stress UspA family protein